MTVNTSFSGVIILLFLLIALTIANNENCNKNNLNKPSSHQVKDLILCDYDKTIRPVLEESPLLISINMLIHHMDFIEKRSIIQIKGWSLVKWRDEHLYWIPQNYNNVTVIFLSPNNIWIPDIVVFNANRMKTHRMSDSKLITSSALCVAFYHKQIFCLIPINISGLCKADFTYWPFDTHNCSIWIESFYHHGDEISFDDIQTEIHDMKKTHNTWHIIDKSVRKDPGEHKCCPNITYPSIKFNFNIRRHLTANIPFILLPYTVLILLTIVTLWLDPKSSDRIYITAVNLFCHTIFLLNSAWELPFDSESVPKLILFLRNSQIFATITVIETIVIRALLNKNNNSPRWLINFFSVFTSSTFGQIFLYSELHSKSSVTNLNSTDGENLIEDQSRNYEWYLLGIVLDRLIFLLFIIIYIIMFMDCIPKQ